MLLSSKIVWIIFNLSGFILASLGPMEGLFKENKIICLQMKLVFSSTDQSKDTAFINNLPCFYCGLKFLVHKFSNWIFYVL